MIMKWVRRDEWKTEKLPVGIENFKQSTKNYARTFQPTMSWDEYIEYSCAVTPQVRQTGNRLSGLAGTAYASLLT